MSTRAFRTVRVMPLIVAHCPVRVVALRCAARRRLAGRRSGAAFGTNVACAGREAHIRHESAGRERSRAEAHGEIRHECGSREASAPHWARMCAARAAMRQARSSSRRDSARMRLKGGARAAFGTSQRGGSGRAPKHTARFGTNVAQGRRQRHIRHECGGATREARQAGGARPAEIRHECGSREAREPHSARMWAARSAKREARRATREAGDSPRALRACGVRGGGGSSGRRRRRRGG